MTEFMYEESNESPTWRLVDLFVWKLLPQKFGGDINYIQKFKDGWVQHNKVYINSVAKQHKIPPELLAGVCWIEVGGDPNFIDSVAFEVRSFDWSGPPWVDKNLTITKKPAKTSFGSVRIQLRTAAQTLGLNTGEMTTAQHRELANCLEKDVDNFFGQVRSFYRYDIKGRLFSLKRNDD